MRSQMRNLNEIAFSSQLVENNKKGLMRLGDTHPWRTITKLYQEGYSIAFIIDSAFPWEKTPQGQAVWGLRKEEFL